MKTGIQTIVSSYFYYMSSMWDDKECEKVFGNKRGNELWDYFLEVGRSIFILEDSYFLINDRNVFSLCLAECSDYDLYELVHNIDTDSDQGK